MSQAEKTFFYLRRVAFHETDAMGVVHHSNYIKFFEEARVHWLRDRGMIGVHRPEGPYTFAVVDLNCRFLKTARFDDLLEIWVQGHMEGARMHFRYAVWNQRTDVWAATGSTELVPVNDDLRPVRLPKTVRELFVNQVWGEVWPPERCA